MPLVDPQNGYRFGLEIAGILDAMFTECSGLEMKIDVEEYKEGGQNDYLHKLPGRRSFNNITLKRAMYNSIELWQWLDRMATASAKRDEKKNISIVMYDTVGNESVRWNLTNAFPVKWSSPTIQTSESGIVIESLELTYDEFTFQKTN